MEKKEIPSNIDISENIRKKLLAVPLPEQEWFDFVREECQKGFDAIGKRIWKDFCLVNGIGGQVFGTQEQVLRGFLGDIPILQYLKKVANVPYSTLGEYVDLYGYGNITKAVINGTNALVMSIQYFHLPILTVF